MMEGQERRDEGGKNCRCADIADDRDALAQFGARKAAHRQQNNRHQDVGWHRAGRSKRGNYGEQDDEYRKRDNADLEIDDRPPTFGPPALARALPCARRALGVLHLIASHRWACIAQRLLARVIGANTAILLERP